MVKKLVLSDHMGNDPKISELTISQLQQIIHKTVQEAVAEVIIEFSAVAEAEEQIRYEAEMTDYLRATMQGLPLHHLTSAAKLDD